MLENPRNVNVKLHNIMFLSQYEICSLYDPSVRGRKHAPAICNSAITNDNIKISFQEVVLLLYDSSYKEISYQTKVISNSTKIYYFIINTGRKVIKNIILCRWLPYRNWFLNLRESIWWLCINKKYFFTSCCLRLRPCEI